MIRTFATQVEHVDETLQDLHEELSQSGEQLWEESTFGELTHEFSGRVNKVFEVVVPPVEGPRHISRTVEVESWVFRNPIRFHPEKLRDRVKDFVRTLFGHYHPAAEYWRTVVPQKEKRVVSTVDTRVPRGSGMTIRQDVTVQRPAAALVKAVRSRRRTVFEATFLHMIRSEAWWEAVCKSWRRMWGETDGEAPFEPRLFPHQLPVVVEIPPVTLDELTPPAQAYWKRRWELEAEVRNVTGFMHQWQGQVDAEVQRAEQLKSQKDGLQRSVAALPRPIEGQQKLQELQNRMDVSERAAERYAEASTELETKLAALLNETKAAREDTLGP